MFQTNIKCIVRGIAITGSIFFASCQSSQQLMDPSTVKANINKESIIPISSATFNNLLAASLVNVQPSKKSSLLTAASNMLQLKYAGLLGVMPESIGNVSLYRFIEEWYGVRYRLGGNDKHGIDCSAFVQRLYENVFGTNLFRTAIEQFSSCRMVFNTDSLKEGDLVFFKSGRRISHVGIYLMNNFFVHASSSRGVMISNLGDDYWGRLYAGAGQITDCNNSSL